MTNARFKYYFDALADLPLWELPRRLLSDDDLGPVPPPMPGVSPAGPRTSWGAMRLAHPVVVWEAALQRDQPISLLIRQPHEVVDELAHCRRGVLVDDDLQFLAEDDSDLVDPRATVPSGCRLLVGGAAIRALLREGVLGGECVERFASADKIPMVTLVIEKVSLAPSVLTSDTTEEALAALVACNDVVRPDARDGATVADLDAISALQSAYEDYFEHLRRDLNGGRRPRAPDHLRALERCGESLEVRMGLADVVEIKPGRGKRFRTITGVQHFWIPIDRLIHTHVTRNDQEATLIFAGDFRRSSLEHPVVIRPVDFDEAAQLSDAINSTLGLPKAPLELTGDELQALNRTEYVQVTGVIENRRAVEAGGLSVHGASLNWVGAERIKHDDELVEGEEYTFCGFYQPPAKIDANHPPPVGYSGARLSLFWAERRFRSGYKLHERAPD